MTTELGPVQAPGTQEQAQPLAAKVAVLYTSAPKVVQDIGRAMRMADFASALDKTAPTALKVNISWQHWYPGCSSTPWQIEGVVRALREEGFADIIAAHNGTVVVDSHEGEVRNKHKAVQDRFGIESVHLTDKGVPWVRYAPKAEMLVLDKIFPDGIEIPQALIGRNVVHLPTMKTHVFTTMTGAMKNAFGGLLHFRRHWTHSQIHKTLVDLLAIQKEIHSGIFAVMDGTIAGDGPGPRAMRPHVKNLILASSDMVAIDAVAAKMMGFEPLELEFIRLAHERGLGVGDPRQIEVVGLDISGIDFGFAKDEDTFASWGQKQIYWGPLHFLEKPLLRSPIVPWSYVASNVYYNLFWYPLIGRGRVKAAKQTEWGKLFDSY
ncbi:MAG TPA: DUF362 domain-containing protein [Dehalococcoidia bacterium]|nr:DUF362 domain-containing protein [Dehalococcoidia bacterium]